MGLSLDTLLFLIMCNGFRGARDGEQIPVFETHEVEDGEGDEPDLLNTWIDYALPDVAYYLRQHKFNDFDRRSGKTAEVKELHLSFPSPPLRNLHWEVEAYCSQGFVPCLKYLRQTVEETTLQRPLDSTYLMNINDWMWPRDRKQIRRSDIDCKRLREQAEVDPEPFSSTLQRFQWRTSASYYMCMFTMKELPWLSMIGDRCDNFAWCLLHNSTEWGDHPWRLIAQWEQNNTFPFSNTNNDPRANDDVPFACALYSFCPDPCCPLRQVESVSDCFSSEGNPCWMSEAKNLTCSLDKTKNTHLPSLTLNRINLTCNCDTPGYIWESRYNACIDDDECADPEVCDEITETCLNQDGSFVCYCKFGFIRNKGKCEADHQFISIGEKAIENGSETSEDPEETDPPER